MSYGRLRIHHRCSKCRVPYGGSALARKKFLKAHPSGMQESEVPSREVLQSGQNLHQFLFGKVKKPKKKALAHLFSWKEYNKRFIGTKCVWAESRYYLPLKEMFIRAISRGVYQFTRAAEQKANSRIHFWSEAAGREGEIFSDFSNPPCGRSSLLLPAIQKPLDVSKSHWLRGSQEARGI